MVVGKGHNLVETLQLFFHVGQVVGIAAVEKGETQHAADAHIFHSLSLLRQEEIHVAETGGARFYHLEATQFGAPVDNFLVEVFLVGPYFGVEPFLQGQVVAVAAEKRHGDVGVHIHESGQRGHAFGVYHLAVGGLRSLNAGGDFGNAVAFHKDVGFFVVEKYVFDKYAHCFQCFNGVKKFCKYTKKKRDYGPCFEIFA